MEFVFLGTSSGVPTSTRNVSGLVIKRRNNKSWCLVDCGEGTQHQLQKLPFSLLKLDAIFITHVHGDHCYGLPGLLASSAMAGRKEPLPIIGPKGVWEFISATMAATDMHMSYDIAFTDIENFDGLEVGNSFHVSACALSHRVPSFAYIFDEKMLGAPLDTAKLEAQEIPKGPLWGSLARGERVQLDDGRWIDPQEFTKAPKKPRRIIVGGDNDTPSLLADVAQDCEVLIHEATYTQAVSEKVGKGPQHSSARDVATFAEKAGVKNLVLTHFSARYHLPPNANQDMKNRYDSSCSIHTLHDEAAANYSGNLFLANDFDQFDLDAKNSKLTKK